MNRRSLIDNWFSLGIRKSVSTFISLVVLSSLFALGIASQPALAASVVTKTAKHLSNFQLRPVLSEKANPGTAPCPAQSLSGLHAATLQACSKDGKTLYTLGAVVVGSIDVTSAKLTTQVVPPAVSFVVYEAAAKIINAVTTQITVLAAPKNELAIVLAGRVLVASKVIEAISGGKFQFTFGTVSKATSFFNELTTGYTPETRCNKEGQTSKSGRIVLQCQKWGSNLTWMVISN